MLSPLTVVALCTLALGGCLAGDATGATQQVTAAQQNSSTPHDRFPALNALFNNSYIPIPKIVVNATENLQLTLSEIYCGNLFIDRFTTTGSAVHYTLDLLNASMDCQGRWDYVLDGTSHHPGTFKAAVSDVKFLIEAEGSLDSKYHLPADFQIATCSFGSKVFTSFKGTSIAWILDLLRPVADAAIDAALIAEVCKVSRPIVVDALNDVTSLLTSVLGPYLDDPTAPVTPIPAPTPAPAPGTVVNWAEVPVVSQLIATLNAMGPDSLNMVFALITGGTGQIDNLPLGNLTLRSSSALANSSLVLQHMSVGGLDTLTSFDILDPDRKHDNSTIDTTIGFGQFSVSIRAELQIWRGSGLGPAPPQTTNPPVSVTGAPTVSLPSKASPVSTQLLDLSFNFTNASISVDIWAPLRTNESDGFSSLCLGHLTDFDCILSKMDGLQLLFLAPNASAIHGPAVTQVVEPGSEQPPSDLWNDLGSILQLVEATYYPSLIEVLPQLGNGLILEGLDLLLYSLHEASQQKCDAKSLEFPGFVDWSDKTAGPGALMWLADIAVNGILKAAGLDGVINKLVPGGLVNKAGAVLDKDVIRDDFGHAHVNISNLTLHGLASFSELIFPRAASSESIEMAATIDSTGKVDTSIPTADANAPARDPIGISFRTRMDYEPSADRGSSAILNDFTTDIKFDNLALATTLTALVNRSRLAQQRLSDLSFQNLATFINETTAALIIDELNLSSTAFGIDVICAHCDTSPLKQLGTGLEEPAAKVQLTKFFNVAIGTLHDVIVSGLNTKLSDFLHYNDTPSEIDEPWVPDFFVIMCMGLGAVFCVFVVLVTGKCFCRDRGSRHQSLKAFDVEKNDKGHAHPRTHRSHSMACSLSKWASIAFLTSLVCNYALYLAANNLIGTAINIRITTFDDAFNSSYVNLYNFTLENSVSEMWDGGVYFLAVAIALFSGIWPYLKLLLMFLSWTAPTRVLPMKARYRLLIVMDALGKWSLIDAFVLVLMMNTFKLSVSLEYLVGFPLFEVDLIANPDFGIYFFMIATIAALMNNHIELNAHRHLQFPERYRLMHEAAKSTNTDISKRKEALCSQSFRCRRVRKRPQQSGTATTLGETLMPSSAGSDASPSTPRKRRETLACRFWVRYFVTVVLVVCAIGLLFGAFIDSFAFEMKGLATLVLGNKTSQPYSLISVGNVSSLLVPEANPSAVFGYYFLQTSYYAFALAVPVLYLVVLLLMWVVPMTLTAQHKVFVFSEMLAAWSAVDVFILSIVVALLELPQYVSFIVGDKCDLVDPITAQFPWLVPDGDTHCFDVSTTLKSGCWVLTTATVVYLTTSYTLTRVCDRAIEERSRMYHRLLSDTTQQSEESASDCGSSSEDEDFDDLDRPFVNCDDKCGECLFRCFRGICFVRTRRRG